MLAFRTLCRRIYQCAILIAVQKLVVLAALRTASIIIFGGIGDYRAVVMMMVRGLLNLGQRWSAILAVTSSVCCQSTCIGFARSHALS